MEATATGRLSATAGRRLAAERVDSVVAMMRGVVAGAVAAAALVGAGCSVNAPKAPPDSSTEAQLAQGAQPPPAQYISDEELAKLKADTPEHAVLAFWQAVQYKNLLLAYDGLASGFKREFAGSQPRFSKSVSADFQHWLTPPKFLFTRRNGSTAVVAFSYRPQGLPDADRSTVTLVRERGQWRIAYLFYLANRLRGQ
jgi:hypothetical protein